MHLRVIENSMVSKKLYRNTLKEACNIFEVGGTSSIGGTSIYGLDRHVPPITYGL